MKEKNVRKRIVLRKRLHNTPRPYARFILNNKINLPQISLSKIL